MSAPTIVRFVSDGVVARQRLVVLTDVFAIQVNNVHPEEGFPTVSVALWVGGMKDPFYEDMPQEQADELIRAWLRARGAVAEDQLMTVRV